MGWRGTQVQNLRILVCPPCTDKLQENGLRTIRIPADPVPVMNARIEPYLADESANGPTNVPYGTPLGLDQGAVMPFQGTGNTAYGVQLPVVSVIGSGNLVTITLSAATTFSQTYPQISVLGLTQAKANGFYSINVVSPIVITYSLLTGVTATGSLLGPRTRIITCNVGLPRGQSTITVVAAPNA